MAEDQEDGDNGGKGERDVLKGVEADKKGNSEHHRCSNPIELYFANE